MSRSIGLGGCSYCGGYSHISADCPRLVAEVELFDKIPTPEFPRPIERIDQVLAELRRYWHQAPYLRLGQIVGNFASEAHQDPYHYEDDLLLSKLREENQR